MPVLLRRRNAARAALLQARSSCSIVVQYSTVWNKQYVMLQVDQELDGLLAHWTQSPD